jgi:hypothetical protein
LELRRDHGLELHAFVLIRILSIPKTTSGKIQRYATCVFRLMSPPNSAAIRHPNPEEVATQFRYNPPPIEKSVLTLDNSRESL